jgi:hypothetical protein
VALNRKDEDRFSMRLCLCSVFFTGEKNKESQCYWEKKITLNSDRNYRKITKIDILGVD